MYLLYVYNYIHIYSTTYIYIHVHTMIYYECIWHPILFKLIPFPHGFWKSRLPQVTTGPPATGHIEKFTAKEGQDEVPQQDHCGKEKNMNSTNATASTNASLKNVYPPVI